MARMNEIGNYTTRLVHRVYELSYSSCGERYPAIWKGPRIAMIFDILSEMQMSNHRKNASELLTGARNPQKRLSNEKKLGSLGFVFEGLHSPAVLMDFDYIQYTTTT